jgi:hypothetical protein
MITLCEDPDEAGLRATVLLVGAESHDVRVRDAGPGSRHVHTAETLAPRRCRCGEVHRPTDSADVVISVGARDSAAEPPRLLSIALFSSEHAVVSSGGHWMVAPADVHFSGWAQQAIGFLLGLFEQPGGVIGYCATDVPIALGAPRCLHFHEGEHDTDIVCATEAMLAATHREHLPGPGAVLGLHSTGDVRLRELAAAAEQVVSRIDKDANLILTDFRRDQGARATLLW